MTRAVFEAGGLAPEVFEEISLDGRPGLVMARFDGPSLLEATKTQALSFDRAGAILAECLHAVHETPPPPDVPLLRDGLARSLEFARETLPDAIASGVAALLARLPPDAALCHGDPNPGNVILTADGPKLIDWIARYARRPRSIWRARTSC
jgi:aminoglycoside phosphotransferase